ncbi:Rmf/CrpP fold protein [Sphaerisporangium viridialbum]|uniref:Rmf/CrpP fold protein n=1 Tax=Sphaerisporangium viridialbum TaxID=46189 RepID=UPI003C71BB5A
MTTVSEVDRRAAVTFGRLAGQRSMPIDSCPYSARGDDRHRVLRLLWIRTYLRYQPDSSAR